MLSLKSYVRVVDNSGCYLAQCIGLSGTNKFGRVGDVISVSLKGVHPRRKVFKGMVSKAIIVRTVKEKRLSTGDVLKFSDNAVVLVNSNLIPLSKRLSGPVSKELRPRYNRGELRVKYLRILALTAFIV